MAPRTTATKRRRLNSSTVNPPPLPSLPFDLVVEILYGLPVKSLIQFKSVCKSWKSLISDSKFAKEHLRVSTTRHHLLFRRLYKREYTINTCPLSSLVANKKGDPTATATRKLEYPISYRQKYDKICGSCHGILCIQLERSVFLWNPSIRKITRLPSLEIPGTYAIYTSFGYDHSSDSYKVVALCTKLGHGFSHVQTHVHNVGGTNYYWRRIQDFPPRDPNHKSGKFVSGTLNWLAYNHSSIVSLDLETESYRELLQPDYGEVDVLSKSLWVLRDCLSILYVYEDDQVLLEFQSKLVIYDSRDGTFKTLKIQKHHGWMIPEVYQESLISPCS